MPEVRCLKLSGTAKQPPESMKTVTFYSYKGGVGRSLALANVAWILANAGLKVLVMDLDLEAPGMHYKLGNPSAQMPLKVKSGLVDYLEARLNAGAKADLLKSSILEVPGSSGSGGLLKLLPAGNPFSHSYWKKVGILNWNRLFQENLPIGFELLIDLKRDIEALESPDVLLIDTRTGVTELGGAATGFLTDAAVLFLVNNQENIDGTRLMLKAILEQARLKGQASVDWLLVNSKVPQKSHVRGMGVKKYRSLSKSFEARLKESVLTHLDHGFNLDERVVTLISEPRFQMEEVIAAGNPWDFDPNAYPVLWGYFDLALRLNVPILNKIDAKEDLWKELKSIPYSPHKMGEMSKTIVPLMKSKNYPELISVLKDMMSQGVQTKDPLVKAMAGPLDVQYILVLTVHGDFDEAEAALRGFSEKAGLPRVQVEDRQSFEKMVSSLAALFSASLELMMAAIEGDEAVLGNLLKKSKTIVDSYMDTSNYLIAAFVAILVYTMIQSETYLGDKGDERIALGAWAYWQEENPLIALESAHAQSRFRKILNLDD